LRVLIIGYGSIGKRHEEVLLDIEYIKSVDIVTRQKIDNRVTFTHLEKVESLNRYDYFVIASETNRHYEQLRYLESNLINKTIFCEKPLFETKRKLVIKKNTLFVGYVLRFHPLLDRLNNFLKNEQVISANVSCGQYLPSWRAEIDYSKSYSASKKKGGGVLLDLSHEIDYIQWMFGKLQEVKSYQVKISDLEIDSDDMTTFIGKTERGVIITLSIDYISKITHRRVMVHTIESSYELDFIQNTLIQKDKKGLEQRYSISNLQRNYMFESMHNSIIRNSGDSACTFDEAEDTMEIITTIQEQNSE
jgi:CMP-N,N'-diacetyllegionaminic acid synthase